MTAHFLKGSVCRSEFPHLLSPLTFWKILNRRFLKFEPTNLLRFASWTLKMWFGKKKKLYKTMCIITFNCEGTTHYIKDYKSQIPQRTTSSLLEFIPFHYRGVCSKNSLGPICCRASFPTNHRSCSFWSFAFTKWPDVHWFKHFHGNSNLHQSVVI